VVAANYKVKYFKCGKIGHGATDCCVDEKNANKRAATTTKESGEGAAAAVDTEVEYLLGAIDLEIESDVGDDCYQFIDVSSLVETVDDDDDEKSECRVGSVCDLVIQCDLRVVLLLTLRLVPYIVSAHLSAWCGLYKLS